MQRILERFAPSYFLLPTATLVVICCGGNHAVVAAFLGGLVASGVGNWLNTYGITHHRHP